MSESTTEFSSLKAVSLSAFIVTVVSSIVGWCLWADSRASSAPEPRAVMKTQVPVMAAPAGAMRGTPMVMPAFQYPAVVTAEEAAISNDAAVIGVVVGDQVRAYSITGMSSPASHVLNDYVSGTAVTVAYCDLSDCSRVFGQPGAESPLTLRVGGWLENQMSVTYEGQLYPLDSTDIPLEEMPYSRTTWGEWKEQYPQSKVFVGGPNAAFGRIHVGDQGEVQASPG